MTVFVFLLVVWPNDCKLCSVQCEINDSPASRQVQLFQYRCWLAGLILMQLMHMMVST